MPTTLRPNLQSFILLLVAFFSSALPFISSSNKLLGEPFDTRFQIVVHQHWFWFLKGERPLRDIFIFYPFDKTLGYSDIFLVNGSFYAIIRFFGLEVLNAWAITNYVVILLGNIGFIFLSMHIYKFFLTKFLVILTLTNSYTFLVFLNIWPNTVGYSMISWILFFLYKIYTSENRSMVWFNGYMIFLPLFTLSFWYPSFFSICGTILLVIFMSIKNYSKLKVIIKNSSNTRNFRLFLIISPAWITLWALFLYIILPTRENLRRSPDEILRGSLDVSDFFVTSLIGSDLSTKILSIVFEPSQLVGNNSWAAGFSLILILFFIYFSWIFRLKIIKFDNLYSYTFFAIILSLILTIKFSENGLYIYLWNNFETLGIIRGPVRLNILISILMILFVFKSIEYKVESSTRKIKILLIVLIILISFDQFRFINGTWTRSNLINQSLIKQSIPVKENCKYFVLVNEGSGHWSDTIEGILFSSLINLPTLNGYSGTSPADVIERDWIEPSSHLYALRYIERNNLDLEGCVVSNHIFSKIKNFGPHNFYNIQGGSIWESNEKKYWHWFTSENSSMTVKFLKLQEFKKSPKVFISKAPCQENLELKVEGSDISTTLVLNDKNSTQTLDLKSAYNAEEFIIQIEADSPGCTVENDSRSLIFSIEIER